MAQQALGPGTVLPRKRALFGLLDADGWAWASVKAFVWLVIIILMLGYLPDRAYYLTVGRTVDLGVLVWSPINLCPPTNETLPCPAPVGAVDAVGDVARRAEPARSRGPTARVLQVGTQILYIGGSDGTTAQSTVYVAPDRRDRQLRQVGRGPEAARAARRRERRVRRGQHLRHRRPRRRGRPDDDRLRAQPRQPDRRSSASGRTAKDLALPEARAETASAITPDGLLIVGGRNADGPVATTWKTKLDSQGKLGRVVAGAAAGHAAGRRDRRPRSATTCGCTAAATRTDRSARSSAARSARRGRGTAAPIRTWAS